MLSSLRKVVHPWKWLEAQRQQQRAYRELMALDDSALADIGITRADIPYVVFGSRQTQREVEMRGSKKPPIGGAVELIRPRHAREQRSDRRNEHQIG